MIVKFTGNKNFAAIPNDLLQSKELTLLEKGMLSYLLSLPSDWKVYKTSLVNLLPDSKITIDKAFKGLQQKGYIHSRKAKNDKGSFKGWNHYISNCPISEEMFNREFENPTYVNPDSREK